MWLNDEVTSVNYHGLNESRLVLALAMTLATRGGEQANQEKRDSNFNKCPQLLVFANITSKAEVPGNTPELQFACGSTIQKTLHTYSHCTQ